MTKHNEDTRKIRSRHFFYIDAMPGAGKTEFFVNTAANTLTSWEPKSNLIYVAPTVQLLLEALLRLQKRLISLNAEPKIFKKIHLVASTGLIEALTNPYENASSIYPHTKPREVLNFLLGLDVECSANGPVMPLDVGEVILTTHESFVQVSLKDKTGQNFKTLRRTDVIFDEARHCVMESKALNDMSSEVLTRAFNCFTIKQIASSKASSKGRQPWNVFEISNALSPADMKTHFGVSNYLSIPANIRNLRGLVDRYSDSGRASVYLMTNEKLKTLSKRGLNISLYTVLRPTSLFDYYRRVVLTSAFFKDSQMYHFLKKDGHSFSDLRKQNHPSLRSMYKRDRVLRETLPQRLRVGVLLKNPERKIRKEYRNTLTSGLLENNIVLPTKLMEKVPQYIDPSLTTQDIMAKLVRGGSVSENQKFSDKLHEFTLPPLWLLIKEACAIIQSEVTTGQIDAPRDSTDYERMTMLILNVAHKKWGPRRIPYTYVIRKLYNEGRLTNKASTDYEMDDVHTKEDHVAIRHTPKKLAQELSEALYVGSPSRKFLVPSTNKMHGINRYSDIKSFVHLAALNPSPRMIRFYKILLGDDYDIDQDHAIENLVQMLYRTSLRKPDAKEQVLMIVPYESQATLLQTKIGCADFTYVNKPRLVRWDYTKPVDEETKQRSAYAGARASAQVRKIKWAPEDKAAVLAARVSLSRYRKKMKDNPTHQDCKKWMLKVKEFETRLSNLGA